MTDAVADLLHRQGSMTLEEFLKDLRKLPSRGGIFMPVLYKHPGQLRMEPAYNNNDTVVWSVSDWIEFMEGCKDMKQITSEALIALLMTTGKDEQAMEHFLRRHLRFENQDMVGKIVSKAKAMAKSEVIVMESEAPPFVLPIEYIEQTRERDRLKEYLLELDGGEVMNDESALACLASLTPLSDESSSNRRIIVDFAAKFAQERRQEFTSSSSSAQRTRVELNEDKYLQEGTFLERLGADHIAYTPFAQKGAHEQVASAIAAFMTWFEGDDVFAVLHDPAVFSHMSMCAVISGNAPVAHVCNMCLLFTPEENPWFYDIQSCAPSQFVARPMTNGCKDRPEVIQWDAEDRTQLLTLVSKAFNVSSHLDGGPGKCYEIVFQANDPMSNTSRGTISNTSPFKASDLNARSVRQRGVLDTELREALQWTMTHILTKDTMSMHTTIECTNVRVRIGKKGEHIDRHQDGVDSPKGSYGESLLVLCLKGRYTIAVESKQTPGTVAYVDMRPGRSYLMETNLYHQQQGTTESTTVSVIWAIKQPMSTFIPLDRSSESD
jgi:hypothetical protein